MKSGERLFARDSTASYLPCASYGYLVKLGVRDCNGGGGFIFCEHGIRGRMFFGQQLASSDSIEWKELISSTNIDNFMNVPIGAPQPWPTTTAPTGWLKCNGASFDTSLYPKLATAYPTGILPDLRGEFIRGYDDGRGIDSGRAILSSQGDAIRNITGRFGGSMFMIGSTGMGAFEPKTYIRSDGGNGGDNMYEFNFDASKVVPTANENRPRNIAFMYIVKAE